MLFSFFRSSVIAEKHQLVYFDCLLLLNSVNSITTEGSEEETLEVSRLILGL